MIRQPGLKSLIKRHIIDRYYALLLRRQAKLLLTRSILNQPTAMPVHRPRLLMLPNVRGWAFDDFCQQRADYLRATWDVAICYTKENPSIDPSQYDMMFNPNQRYSPLDALFHGRYIRGIFSWKCMKSDTPNANLFKNLQGAVACVVPNTELANNIRPHFHNTFIIKEGINPKIFRFINDRSGKNLVVGWAGNPDNIAKRYRSVVLACEKAGVELRVATSLAKEQLNLFYNDVDVVVIASVSEGNPYAIFEAGAAGRSVIATRVGVVPEIIIDGENGFIVNATSDNEQTVRDISEKLLWCKMHVEQIRGMGKRLRERILAERLPELTGEMFRQVVELAWAISRGLRANPRI